ncbi:MAG TPA: hypothetical protein VFF73_15290, partial [Planctomycetota bacterium]|nr:hypothetical protein [Planctomycetota bacterium]
MNCAEVRSLLPFRPIEVLEDEEAGPLDLHLESCVACRDEARAVEEAFAKVQAPEADEPLPESVWTNVVKGIEAAPVPVAQAPVVADVTIAISCAYCRDTLTRAEASYCASCLAPHHEDCWRQHGRCSAFGCEETHVVRPHTDTAPPARRISKRVRYGGVLIFVTGTISVAAIASMDLSRRERVRAAALDRELTEKRTRLEKEMAHRAEAERAFEERRRAQQEEIDLLNAVKNRTEDEKIEAARKFEIERRKHQDDLEAQGVEIARLRRDYERKLARERRATALEPPLVTLDVKEADLADVLAAVSSQTGKTFDCSSDVHEKITIRVKQIPWACAIALLAREARCVVFEVASDDFHLAQPPRVTIQFTEASLPMVFNLLGSYTGSNMLVDDSVHGAVTLDLYDVYWTEAIESIARACGCRVGRRGNTITVTRRASLDIGSPNLAGDGVHVWSLAQVLGETTDSDSLPERTTLEKSAVRCSRCDARTWLPLLARCCGKSLIVTEAIKGDVTLDLAGVSYEEALQTSLKRLGDLVAVPDGDQCLRVEATGAGDA